MTRHREHGFWECNSDDMRHSRPNSPVSFCEIDFTKNFVKLNSQKIS